MKQVLKWLAIVIGVLVVIVGLAVVLVPASVDARLNKNYNFTPAALAIPSDAASIERGKYLYNAICMGCHMPNLEGKMVFDDPALGQVPATNLTTGSGGITNYTDVDFVRAIRHGINPEGKALIMMPAEALYFMSDTDLAAVIAFLKSAAPVDKDSGQRSLTLMGKILLAAGAFGDMISAEVVDHEQAPPTAPQRSVSAEYGEYLMTISHCWLCHGENYAGAQPPQPGSPYGSNLTPGGALSTWSLDDFKTTLRTGVTPTGHQINNVFMPYEDFGNYDDDDLTAIFTYLQSLPALETNKK